MKRLFGIVGNDLEHSFSPKFFEEKFEKEGIVDCEYKLFSLEEASHIPSFLTTHSNLEGFNVTMPYKKEIIPFLDDMDSIAKSIGAVNVVKILNAGEKKEYIGYNTDAVGFKMSLKPLLKAHHTHALVLGTGGAAQAIAFTLKELGIDFKFVSRKKENNKGYSYLDLNKDVVTKHTLIINTTPVGMFPNLDDTPLPIPYQFVAENHLLYDVIYNPEKTHFLRRGMERGATIKNGLEMLHLQAEKAWAIWND